MPDLFEALLPDPPQQPSDSVQTHIQVGQGGTERNPDKVVALRIEEVSMATRVDIEEDAWDHDRLFLQKLFEESLCSSGVLVWVSRLRREERTRPLFNGGGRLSKFNQI